MGLDGILGGLNSVISDVESELGPIAQGLSQFESLLGGGGSAAGGGGSVLGDVAAVAEIAALF